MRTCLIIVRLPGRFMKCITSSNPLSPTPPLPSLSIITLRKQASSSHKIFSYRTDSGRVEPDPWLVAHWCNKKDTNGGGDLSDDWVDPAYRKTNRDSLSDRYAHYGSSGGAGGKLGDHQPARRQLTAKSDLQFLWRRVQFCKKTGVNDHDSFWRMSAAKACG